jgi:hypothetical protein
MPSEYPQSLLILWFFQAIAIITNLVESEVFLPVGCDFLSRVTDPNETLNFQVFWKVKQFSNVVS